MSSIFDILLGIILVVHVIGINLISTTRIAFSGPILSLGVLLIIYHFIKKRFSGSNYFRKYNKILKVFICIGLVFFLGIEIAIIGYPKRSEENTDYIIVLGAGLNNGEQLSYILKDRLDTALKCRNEFKNDGYIVVSGGKGNDEKISEAEAMKRYLLDQGVAEDKILMEDKSRNTYENFKYSKEVIEKHSKSNIDNSSVKVVTTDFHGLRSELLAKRNGYGKVKLYTTKTIYYLIPVCYTREAFALVKSILFDR